MLVRADVFFSSTTSEAAAADGTLSEIHSSVCVTPTFLKILHFYRYKYGPRAEPKPNRA